MSNKCLILTDFTADNFLNILRNLDSEDRYEFEVAPSNQPLALLLDQNNAVWQGHLDIAIVWTRPEALFAQFQRLMQYEAIDEHLLLQEVDRFIECLQKIAKKIPTVLIANWTFDPQERGWGLLDWHPSMGFSYFLSLINHRLAEGLGSSSNAYIQESRRWIACAGKNAYDPRLWYMGKVPFSPEVFREAAMDCLAALGGLAGKAKKLLLVDLDDTLWGGIVGDEGWPNLRLGGHDPIGEAFADFQRSLKNLRNRGILLGIVSKNEEQTALDAIANHPEMILRKDDFIIWRINWQDKATNIIEVAKELNLGLQSIVFLDDNPVERARVRDALPEVLVPEMPANKMFFKKTLLGLDCFDAPQLSEEDGRRHEMYVVERERQEIMSMAQSFDDWLAQLKLEVIVEEINVSNLPRTVQLLNKTNQMNLRTRRLTESEFQEWRNLPFHYGWTFRVSDCYGDSGLTGIATIEKNGDEATISDFILSCRVMGRKVEESMIYALVEFSRSLGIKKLWAHYLPTEKNKPCLALWQASGFERIGNENEHCFFWDTNKSYPRINLIKLSDCLKVEDGKTEIFLGGIP